MEGHHKNIDAIKNEIKNCYVEVASYLQSHLPYDNTFVRDARELHLKYKKKNGLAAIGRLAYLMAGLLKDTSISVKQPATLADEIRRQ